MKFRVRDIFKKRYIDDEFYINCNGKLFRLHYESYESNFPIRANEEKYKIEYGSDKYNVFENDKITWMLRSDEIIEGYVRRMDEEFWVTDLKGGNKIRLSKARKLTVIGRID